MLEGIVMTQEVSRVYSHRIKRISMKRSNEVLSLGKNGKEEDGIISVGDKRADISQAFSGY